MGGYNSACVCTGQCLAVVCPAQLFPAVPVVLGCAKPPGSLQRDRDGELAPRGDLGTRSPDGSDGHMRSKGN